MIAVLPQGQHHPTSLGQTALLRDQVIDGPLDSHQRLDVKVGARENHGTAVCSIAG
ncbi:hypothetical protein [Burkholderia ubonensis]|uniref:hypothetical protein n=1 Tax=Burkholderia ubonensis TaxID=101571 RepID=UPI0012FA930C|nr:hypothetical protein [Burkholderia ubonensis]